MAATEKYWILLFLKMLIIFSLPAQHSDPKADASVNVSITPVSEINSPADDFGPVWHKNRLIFCSNNSAIPNKESAEIVKIQAAEKNENGFNAPQEFDPSFDEPWHHGPLSFSFKGDTMFFTSSQKKIFQGNEEKSPLEIRFSIQNKSGKWMPSKPFPHNKKGYNVSHPCLNSNGNILYFSSDMPGGFGGMDLWMSRKVNGEWLAPENLGEELNTSGNEVFPGYFQGILYFSSDGHKGYGKLDLFKVVEKNESLEVQNLKPPVNSAHDDLSLGWVTSTMGYFASNRPGGFGGDDIYKLEQPQRVEVFSALHGKAGSSLANKELFLYNENGVLLQQAITDSLGSFTFNDIEGGNRYFLKWANDPSPKPVSIFLYNSTGDIVKEIFSDENGSFVFELLLPDDHDKLPILENPDKSLLTINIRGQVYEHQPGDIGKGNKVFLLDKNGKLIKEVLTDEEGKFNFSFLTPEDQYLIRVSLDKPELKIIILNEKGELVETLLKQSNGLFTYDRLLPDDDYLVLVNESDVQIKIKLDEKFTIPNIYYELNKSEILPSSARQLDKLVTILQYNKHIKILLSAHTDSRGSAEYNLQLSQRRVESAILHLTKKGINRDQLEGKGFGEQHPVNQCVDGVECTEDEHRQNRRTEFMILKR